LHSSVAQVIDYLDAQKIQHSEYLPDAVRGNSIQAVVRDHRRWAVVKTDVGIVFRFDGHDRLASYEAAEHYTGP